MGDTIRAALVGFALVLPVVCSRCAPPVRLTPPPADAPPEEVALSGASVLIGAGDIARCGATGDEETAALVDSLLAADSLANVKDAVFAAGDIAYPSGRRQDFERCWAESWGSKKYKIAEKILPAPGNHDYISEAGANYYRWFGDRAGPAGKGYYSAKLGEWHIISLNSEIVVNDAYAAQRPAQEAWLKKDLEDNKTACTLAFWHHPIFSSSYHGQETRMRRIYQILYDANVDLVIVGHDHTYERFAPLTPAGVRDSVRGIPQFVVGTGGAELRGFRSPSPGSLSRVQGYYGVLKVTLGAGAYQHAFIDTRGRLWDPGAGKCH